MNAGLKKPLLVVVSLGIALILLLRGRAMERPNAGTAGEDASPASSGEFYSYPAGMGGNGNVRPTLMEGLISIFNAVPAKHDFYRSYEAPLSQYEIEKVKDRASVEKRPYTNEEGRKRAVERIQKNLNYFKEALAEGETRLRSSIQEGGRSESEIREASEALEELKNGIAFCENQMRRIVEDDFD